MIGRLKLEEWPHPLRFVWVLEIMDKLVDLKLDVWNSEPFVEELFERAIGDIIARILAEIIFRVRREMHRGAIGVRVGEGCFLDLVHFEL